MSIAWYVAVTVLPVISLLTRRQVWDLFEGKHLFYGNDNADYNPNGTGYTTRAHLAEVVAKLGPPPLDLLQRGKRSREFFTEDGVFCHTGQQAQGRSR